MTSDLSYDWGGSRRKEEETIDGSEEVENRERIMTFLRSLLPNRV